MLHISGQRDERIVCFRDGLRTLSDAFWNNMKTISQKTAEINNLLQKRHQTMKAPGKVIARCSVWSQLGHRGGRYPFTGVDRQSQAVLPGLGEKYFSNFPSTPSNSFASGRGSCFVVMLGQITA